MWYMHDSVPVHFSCAVRDVLNNTYHAQWIGRGWPTAWSTCSPDLNPLDFYLWGHLQILVRAAPVDNEEAFHHCIVDACKTTRNYPTIFEQMRCSMMRCVETWTEFHGGHFEHLQILQTHSFSYDPQIKCFQAHVVMGISSCFGMWISCPKYIHTFHLHAV
jgi:hypothetical protein